jgi:streptomycin 3"-adenylyltransferase
MPPADPVSAQTDAVLAVMRRVLGEHLLAAYRYGSAEAGGLRPDSDLDLAGVLDRPTTDLDKRALIEGIGPLSRRRDRPATWRPVELTLVVAGDVRPWRWPPRFDFQYGEWLRAEFDAGQLAPWPSANPDVAVLVTMLRQRSDPLLGPSAADLLDPVPRADLVRAMVDELGSLLADLEPDTRNVLLTLARMWCTVATGEIRSKDAAGEWATERLPEPGRSLLRLAADAYLAGGDEDWSSRMAGVRDLAARMAAEVQRAAGNRGP